MTITGGCLCGAVRYAAEDGPEMMGLCCCTDCRKASGSGYIGFMGFPASAVRFSGDTLAYVSLSARGSETVRNSCPTCGSLVFGGRVGVDTSHTIYAGSLDNSDVFKPAVAIFDSDRPEWVALPPGLTVFAKMPG